MKWAPSSPDGALFHFRSIIEITAMPELLFKRDAPSRPAFANLVAAMARLSPRQRNEVARIGRRARAAKVPRIRRLTWQAVAEARRLAREAAQ
jgi:dihydrodipicolinate synthase/N-acetylneuraminate lyase